MPDEPRVDRECTAMVCRMVIDAAEDREPAVGAQVTLVRNYGESGDTLLIGETDALGQLTRPLETLDTMGWGTWNAGGARLLVRYPDHALAHLDLPVEEFTEPGLFEAVLILESKPLLTGRVLDESGAPVVGARCWAIPLVDGKRGSSLSFSQTADDGSFSLEPQPDRSGFIQVDSGGYATASAALDLGQPRDIGDLVLTSGATLEGRVIDGNGEPARGVEIQVHVIGELRQARADGSPRRGRAWAQVPTDRNGAFAFTGLRFGRYSVTATAGITEHFCEVELPCPLLTLRIPEPRLIVSVKDVHGRPEVGVELTVTPLKGPWKEKPACQWTFTWGPESEASVEVVSGATYAVKVEGRAGDTQERIVHIPADCVEHREVLILGEPQVSGSLLVNAVDPDGQAVKISSVAFTTALSGQSIEALVSLQPDEHGRIEELPIGSYKLFV